ncbi:MAG: nitronate monooxygenase [Candidatus Helarchaeota archaeon]|nr:nitronate monooxygenase [Candidatus Helarchaeota archaeon]
MIHTELCDMLNIKHPIIQAGMGPFSTKLLAIAASNAGILGLISHSGGPLMGLEKPVPQIMSEAIDEVAKKTKTPFGVNVRVAKEQPDARKCIAMICEKVQGDSDLAKKLRVVVTSAGDPIGGTKKGGLWAEQLHRAGILHFHVAAATRHALRVQKAGCDAVIASGYEAGGHIALNPVHTWVLLQGAVKAVKIPVIAAGGMADGRSLAAALAMGAVGIQMGTRMIATSDSDFKANYKESFTTAEENATVVLPGFFSPHCRYLANEWTEGLEEKMAQNTPDTELMKYKAEGRYLAAEIGDKRGSILCGQVTGLIKDVPTVKELVDRTIQEAEEILKNLPKYVKS